MRPGGACPGARRGRARRGGARRGGARRDEARRGGAGRGEARRGEAGRGEAGRGRARRGEMRRGEAGRGGRRHLGAQHEAGAIFPPLNEVVQRPCAAVLQELGGGLRRGHCTALRGRRCRRSGGGVAWCGCGLAAAAGALGVPPQGGVVPLGPLDQQRHRVVPGPHSPRGTRRTHSPRGTHRTRGPRGVVGRGVDAP